MEVFDCADRESYERLMSSPRFIAHRSLELSIARKHNSSEVYRLPGFCEACNLTVDFLVDRIWGAQRLEDGTWMPNWRERLECSSCGMASRQRAVAGAVAGILKDPMLRSERPTVYMTEEASLIHRWFKRKFSGVACITSEYLGPQLERGSIHDGIRHEDIEGLSFKSDEIDLIVTNDVLEHVNDPAQALREIARVLRPGGTVFMTVPFQHHLDKNVRRARMVNGSVEHILTPIYHEDHLVFVDFGWDFLKSVQDSGFSRASAKVYWDLEYGYLGRQLYFRATK